MGSEMCIRDRTYTRILIPGGDHRHAVMIDPEELVRSTRARVVDLRAGDR